jgi:hypothetical protein
VSFEQDRQGGTSGQQDQQSDSTTQPGWDEESGPGTGAGSRQHEQSGSRSGQMGGDTRGGGSNARSSESDSYRSDR